MRGEARREVWACGRWLRACTAGRFSSCAREWYGERDYKADKADLRVVRVGWKLRPCGEEREWAFSGIDSFWGFGRGDKLLRFLNQFF